MQYRTPDEDNVADILARGRALWSTIYTPYAEKLYDKLGALHPDFIGAWGCVNLNLPLLLFLLALSKVNLIPLRFPRCRIHNSGLRRGSIAPSHR